MGVSEMARLNGNAARRERYRFLREHGICYICGCQDAVRAGMCGDCYCRWNERMHKYAAAHKEALKQYRAAWYQSKADAGLCVKCGKRPAEEGKRFCAPCLKRARIKANARNAAKRVTRPEWKCRCCEKACAPGYKLCEEHLAAARARLAKARESRAKSP